MDRRSFLGNAGVALTAASALGPLSSCSSESAPRIGAAGIGMCDWNLGPKCDPEQVPLAAEATIQGLQVSVEGPDNEIKLTDPAIRQRFLDLGSEYGVLVHSVAMGLLNSFPLATDPRAPGWLTNAIESAAALGAGNVLMAFFGNGDLRLRDDAGEFQNEAQEGFASYRLNDEHVSNVVAILQQATSVAEDHGVVLGLENTISAAQNLEMIERVGSEWLQIYYDLGNSTGYGYDVPNELTTIGYDRLCEVHLKDWGTPLLGSEDASVDTAGAAAALRVIGYDKWLVLETSGREDHFLEDTRTNVSWAKSTFDMA